MNTKIVSIRLPIDMIKRMDAKCSEKAICRNDYVKSLIEGDLNRLEVKRIRITEI